MQTRKRWLVLFIINIIITAPFIVMGQADIESLVSQVEKNNTTLTALRNKTEADKLANKTGIFLSNPEAAFAYLWGDPRSIGERQDISLRQSFDFPVAYTYKRQLAGVRNRQADLDYEEQRNAILLEARLLCTEIVYYNAMLKEYESRLAQAGEMAKAYAGSFEKGDINIIEYNNTQLNLLQLTQDGESLRNSKAAGLSRLAALNGGTPLSLDAVTLSRKALPEDFNQWYQEVRPKIPELQRLGQAVQESRLQGKLNRAMSLPKVSAGYMSEAVVGEKYSGISVGITIPLWEQKNTVKQAFSQSQYMEKAAADQDLKILSHLKLQYDNINNLNKKLNDYRKAMLAYDNSTLLRKALDSGEISLIDYLKELSYQYDVVDHTLSLEYEMNKSIAILMQYGN